MASRMAEYVGDKNNKCKPAHVDSDRGRRCESRFNGELPERSCHRRAFLCYLTVKELKAELDRRDCTICLVGRR